MARTKGGTWYIGEDPGSDGGLALIRPNGAVETFARIDGEFSNIIIFFKKARAIVGDDRLVCVFEEYKGDGAANATRHSGMYVGIAMATCYMLNIQLIKVAPQTWKAHFGLLVKQAKGEPKLPDAVRYKLAKEKSMTKFEELFPHADIVFPRCRNKHEGVAESLMIAEYGRQKCL